MLSSVLDPSKIINQKRSSPESFQRFMSGGESPLGSSVISSASNKIVGFSRVGVSPVTPDINSILSDISTNIISNVDNSIKNTTNFVTNDIDKKIGSLRSEIYGRLTDIETSINDIQSQTYSAISKVQDPQGVPSSVQAISPVSDISRVVENIQVQSQETLNTTLSNFSKDYQEKIKGINDIKPKNVLEKFLDLYRNAIGFINFFSDRKNINRITDNLKAIRGIFDNTFNVSKILRETILKIVKQLTNLPSASASSPGLDLNVNVPGGGLKQAAGSKASKVGSALKMGALGLGAVGLGAVGAEAAKRFQDQELYKQPEVSGSDLPRNFIEMFSSIVDKFENAIGSLISGTKDSQQTSPSGGGGGGGAPAAKPSGPGATAGGMLSGDAPPEVKAAMEAIAGAEGGWESVNPGKVVPGLTDMTISQARDTGMKQRSVEGSGALGKFQQIPVYEGVNVLKQRAEAAGLNYETDKFSEENQTKITRAYLAGIYPGGEAQLIKDAKTDPMILASKLKGVYPSLPGGSQLNVHSSGYLKRYQENLKKYQTAPMALASAAVAAAPTKTQAVQDTAQSISQPAQKVPTTISLPPTMIDASPPQQQSGSSSTPPPPPGGSGKLDVPFLPTANPNNFYVLYSRSVYNIVDG